MNSHCEFKIILDRDIIYAHNGVFASNLYLDYSMLQSLY